MSAYTGTQRSEEVVGTVERAEDARRAKRIVKARAARAATTRTPRVVDDGVQVGRYLANRRDYSCSSSAVEVRRP